MTVVIVAVEHVDTITTGFFSASHASVSRWSALYATTFPAREQTELATDFVREIYSILHCRSSKMSTNWE